jgi:hypothetical protein
MAQPPEDGRARDILERGSSNQRPVQPHYSVALRPHFEHGVLNTKRLGSIGRSSTLRRGTTLIILRASAIGHEPIPNSASWLRAANRRGRQKMSAVL